MKKLLVYYGWLNAFNSGANGWDNDAVSTELASYDMLVFGAGVADPSHGDYSNTQYIIPKIKELNPNAKIFGYVTANQNITDFSTQVDQWEALTIDGIFFDEAGYDYGVTRDSLNEKINYVKTKTCRTCFVNSWNIEHVVGTTDDPAFPNATFNPSGVESHLERGDWYLAESFLVNTTAYSSNDGLANSNDWYQKGNKLVDVSKERGIKIASLGVIDNESDDGQYLSDMQYYSSTGYDFDASGTSDTNYGASSAAVKSWIIPEKVYWPNWSPSGFIRDSEDNDIYTREGKDIVLKFDFTPKALVSLS